MPRSLNSIHKLGSHVVAVLKQRSCDHNWFTERITGYSVANRRGCRDGRLRYEIGKSLGEGL